MSAAFTAILLAYKDSVLCTKSVTNSRLGNLIGDLWTDDDDERMNFNVA